MWRQRPPSDPEPGMIVALKSMGGKSSARTARVEALSLWPVERLPDAELLTWLDEAIIDNKRPSMAERKFGAGLSAAFRARADWLITRGVGRPKEHVVRTRVQFVVRRRPVYIVSLTIALKSAARLLREICQRSSFAAPYCVASGNSHALVIQGPYHASTRQGQRMRRLT